MIEFTAKELERKLEEISTCEVGAGLPIYFGFDREDSVWEDNSAFPIFIKDFGGVKHLRVDKEDSFYGEEGGDHQMYVIFSVGYGDSKRYFRKDGQYDSWAESSWDGGFYEVEQKERVVKIWEAKKGGEEI